MPIPAHVIPIFLDCVVNIILGLLVLARNVRQPINLSYAIFAFSLGAWSFGIGKFLLSSSVPEATFWARSYYLAGTFIASSLFYFASVFPKGEWLSLRQNLLFLLVATPGTILTILPGSLFEQVIVDGSLKDVILNPVHYFIFSAHFILFFYGALIIVWKKQLKSVGLIKNQLRYVFIGILTASIFGVYFDLILPWFRNYQLIWMGPPFTFFLVGCTGYAIIRHRLMDIRLVIARSIAYTLLLLILGTFYTTGLFLASTYFIKQETNVTNLSVSTILALFMAFTFQPLKTLLEKMTDKIFFKGNYDTQDLLSKLGSIMNSYIDLELLNKKILETIISEVRITRGAFIIFGENSSAIYNIIEIGFNNRFVMSYPESSSFFHLPETTIFDDLEEGEIKNLMRDREVDLVKVLKVNERIIGLLVLGGKASGGVYSSQDLKFLDIISPEVAVAIQNSLSYDKIKKFNFILSQEIQKATSDLQKANERLKSLDALKDDFVSIASHELRTPMTAIRSYAWMALHRSDMALNEKMEKYLIRVLMSSERLINLVNDMLNISRIEAGKIEINPEPIDLKLLCKDIFDEVYYSKAIEKKVNFVLQDSKVPKVFADPDKLRQVLLNLVGNSLKFTPGEGSISIDFFSDGNTVEISVKDTGVGISKEDLGKLFQKFSRLDSSYVASATSGGTGLGLFISKKIIELMHGKIWVASQGLGKGATFTFSLPVASQEVLQNADLYTIKPKGEVKELEPAVI